MARISSKTLITAALPYANGSIHIGHLLEYIQADIYARFLKLQGKDCLYICASDMHGTPIEINAAKAGKPPAEFVEQFWREHQQDFASYRIEFDEYYKTHSPENKELAEFFFQKLKDKKLIYRKTIKAVYCEQCRRYLPDRFVKGTCPHCKAEEQYGDVCEKCSSILKGIDLLTPHCSICGKTPIQKDSEHYFFRLSSFSQKLRTWIFAKKSNLQSEVRNWLQEWLDKGLEDWCVSRDAPYFGFEIPDSKKETGETKYFYVWLDAPIGYISSTKHYCDNRKKKWEDYWKKGKVQHFIGKDIAYFHFLFWPAMLLAVGIPLPSLMVHGFITVSGQKMSKSRGTFFTAKDFLKLYPAEALRFYYGSHLDRHVVDVDLNFDDFVAVNNNVLVGSIGNFCYRVLTFAQKNYGAIKEIASEKKLSGEVLALVKKTEKQYAAQDFRSAVKCIQQIADIGNAYFQKAEPWVEKERKEKQVGWCVQVARILGIVCSPLLPTFGEKVAQAFGEKPRWNNVGFAWKGTIQPVEHLVEKIEKKEQPVIAPVREVGCSVSSEVQQLGIKVRLAQLGGLTIKKRDPLVEKLKEGLYKNIASYERKEILQEYSHIDQRSGVDSSKNPSAVFNLLKMIKEKGRLPQINTVVDVYNVISVESGIAFATHDLTTINGDIAVRVSNEGELFAPLGGGVEKLKAGEMVYADGNRILGRLSKQCQQTITTEETHSLLLIAFGNKFVKEEVMDEALRKTCDLMIKVNGGSYKIVDFDLNVFPLHLAVGHVTEVHDHPNADSLFLLKIDFGPLGQKQSVTSLKKHLPKEAFLNKKIIFCLNLKPAKFRGELSEAMILAAEHGTTIVPLEMKKAAIGSLVAPEGMPSNTQEIAFEDVGKVKMAVLGGKIVVNGKPLRTGEEVVEVQGVPDGALVR